MNRPSAHARRKDRGGVRVRFPAEVRQVRLWQFEAIFDPTHEMKTESGLAQGHIPLGSCHL